MLAWQFSWQAEENPELEKNNNGKNPKNPSADGSNSLPDSVLYNFSPKTVMSPLQSKTGRNAHEKEAAVSKGPSEATESHCLCVEALVSVTRTLQVCQIVVWLLV